MSSKNSCKVLLAVAATMLLLVSIDASIPRLGHAISQHRKLAQPTPAEKSSTCNTCRSIGDFPIFAQCSDEKESPWCCTCKDCGTDGLTCYPQDTAHGGYSCVDTYKGKAQNGYCCMSCDE